MKLMESYPVEFYISDVGYLVFKGRNMLGYPDYEAMIFMSPEQVQIFASCLSDLVHEQRKNWTGVINDV